MLTMQTTYILEILKFEMSNVNMFITYREFREYGAKNLSVLISDKHPRRDQLMGIHCQSIFNYINYKEASNVAHTTSDVHVTGITRHRQVRSWIRRFHSGNDINNQNN